MAQYEKSAHVVAGLTPEQARVTQHGGTERPGTGALLHNKEPGIYVDVVSGEPLFASSDKYESGCGWPSFTKPVEPAHVAELTDASHGMIRTEVRSAHGDSWREPWPGVTCPRMDLRESHKRPCALEVRPAPPPTPGQALRRSKSWRA